jgi:4'-phosphopantetheinyl transferase
MHEHNLLWDAVQCKDVGIGQKDTLQECGFPPVIEKNRIHIWSARYNDLDCHFRILSEVVSSEEQKTASAFRKPGESRNYLLRHGLVRTILAHYTRKTPEKLSFTKGKNGKPELDPLGAGAELSFNLSHTSEMVLIGVTKKRRIGVDIVKMDPSYQFQDTAEYLMAPAEKAFLIRIEPALRYQVFFRMWAIKEAILKVTGSTLARMVITDLSQIMEDVVSSPEYSMSCLDTHPPLEIWQFTIGFGHHAAVAVEAGIAP